MAGDRSMLARPDPAVGGPIRMFGLGMGPNALVPPQPAGWSFLVWVRSGSALVRAHHRLALATGSSAVWIPEGTPFGIEARCACDLRIAYVARGTVASRPFAVLRSTPILREVLERAVTTGYLDPGDARDARLIDVALDELRVLEPERPPFELAMPCDACLRGAIDRVLRDPSHVPSVRDLALAAGMAVRTLERRFVAETGLTPRVWLRRARLHAAAEALAAGASITEAGLAGGYTSLSAFIAAHRREFGVPPGRASRSGLTVCRNNEASSS